MLNQLIFGKYFETGIDFFYLHLCIFEVLILVPLWLRCCYIYLIALTYFPQDRDLYTFKAEFLSAILRINPRSARSNFQVICLASTNLTIFIELQVLSYNHT